MDVRPFHLCAASDRAAFEAHASQALRRWAEEWTGAALHASVACDVVSRVDGSEWWRAQGAAGSVWVAADHARVLVNWLFGVTQTSGMSATASRHALRALAGMVAAAPNEAASAVQSAAAPLHLLEPGRAALCVRVEALGSALTFVVELPAAQRVDSVAREPLVGLKSALGPQQLRIEVWLGQAELDLRSLSSLAIGDVLRLDRKLDEAVELRLNQERLPCAAFLGARDGHVAVEIARR